MKEEGHVFFERGEQVSKLVVHDRHLHGIRSIGMEFQKEFLFDNKLVGLHWHVILVGAWLRSFSCLGALPQAVGPANSGWLSRAGFAWAFQDGGSLPGWPRLSPM